MSSAVVTLTPTNNPEARRLIAGPVDPDEAATAAIVELERLARCGFRASMAGESDAGRVYVLRHPSAGTELQLHVWTTGGTNR